MNKLNKQSKLILVITILYWFAQYIYIPYQTPYLASIQVGSCFIGLVIGAYGVSQMLLRFPVGILADKGINHKILIFLGPLLAGLGSLFRIISPKGTGFLIANIISGMSSATWLSFIVAFLYLNPTYTRTKAMGILIMFNNLGMLLGFAISTLVYPMTNMHFLCLLGIISGFSGALLALTLKKQNYQSRIQKYTFEDTKLVLKNKKLWLYSLLALVQQGIQMSTTMSFTNSIIKSINAPAYCEGVSSIIYMISAVAFAQLTATKYITKLSNCTWIVLSFLMLGVYCFLIPQVKSVYFIYLLQLIPGMGTGVLFSLLNSKAISNVRQVAISSGTGLFQACFAIGMTVFPIIAGELKRLYSLNFAFIVLGVIAVVTAIMYWIIELKE